MSERKKIYIAYTGGTIGMRQSEAGYRPAPGFLEEQMEGMPELRRPEMPEFEVGEYPRLLDSASMTPEVWAEIGRDLIGRYDDYDGFLVLHGTDTMAYSAAALSFMFENLAKPILFTGSQIPLLEVRNDARGNLITSLLIAARYPVPEVCLYFGHHLLRGNRATKVHATGFHAFESPNYPPLGRAGVKIEIARHLSRPQPEGEVSFRPIDEPPIVNVRLFPGLTAETLAQLLSPPTRGAVLHTYGIGNASDRGDFLEAIRAATERGVVVVNCSQCLHGAVDMDGYATGKGLARAGVTGGYDMTPEAATCKLAYLLSLDDDPETVRRRMGEDLRGELTLPAAAG